MPTDFSGGFEFFYLCLYEYDVLKNFVLRNCSGNVESTYRKLSSVSTIYNDYLRGIGYITKIVIPPSIKIIGAWAFCGCSSLSQIIIPSSVTVIRKEAFRGCSFRQITFPPSVINIEEYA